MSSSLVAKMKKAFNKEEELICFFEMFTELYCCYLNIANDVSNEHEVK